MKPIFPYVTEAGVLCKGCGAKIAGPPVPGFLAPEGIYVDLQLLMEYPDGTRDKHSTPMCHICAESCTLADAQDLYLTDLAEWGRDLGPREDVRAWFAKMMTRHPVEVLGAV